MVIYCKSVHFGGFSSPGTPGQAFYEMASFSENRALRLLQESGEPWLCPVRVLSTRLTIWTGQGQAWLPLLGTRQSRQSLRLPDRAGGAEGPAWAHGPVCTSDHRHPFQEMALSATT